MSGIAKDLILLGNVPSAGLIRQMWRKILERSLRNQSHSQKLKGNPHASELLFNSQIRKTTSFLTKSSVVIRFTRLIY